MNRSSLAKLALTLALGGLAALPASTLADSGGASPGSPSPTSPSSAAPATTPTTVASAAGSNGVTLTARAGALVGHTARFRGTVADGAGRTVAVQVLNAATGAWATVAQTTVAGDGTFLAGWRSRHIGQFEARALLVSSGSGATAAGSPPVVTVTVHHQAKATWYGPGFYGKKTACGLKLTHGTLGVAHRSLPCGTEVSILYAGKSLVVPVVDRGPFANGADWDLTAATADALGITVTSKIGELAMRGGRAPST